jgi:hypothetical protein
MVKWIFIILAIALISCDNEEIVEWELKKGDNPPMVVEGLLTNQRTSHLVKLSKPLTEINSEPEMISGANVLITDGNNIAMLYESGTEPGYYYTEADVQGVTGKTYYLRIELDGELFWAADSLVPVSTEEPVNIIDSDSAGFYKLQFYEDGNPAMIEVDIDWRNTSICNDDNCFARQSFYILYNIDVNKQFQSENREEILFPPGTILTRKKYSLSPLHQKFARSMLMETEWRGGYFDVLPGQVFTNVTNGAVGFFAACSVISDTVVVE